MAELGGIMDFKALQEANDSIELTDIKGKKYAQVNQRIKAFRMCYPEGAIVTELKKRHKWTVCVWGNNLCGIPRQNIGYRDSP